MNTDVHLSYIETIESAHYMPGQSVGLSSWVSQISWAREQVLFAAGKGFIIYLPSLTIF